VLQRQVYKACVLGRIYGMGADTLARNLGIARLQAQDILDQMHARYPVLNAWLERVLVKAAHAVPVTCVFGWSLTASGRAGEERTFLNFPMQANGAQLMRLVFARAGDLPIMRDGWRCPGNTSKPEEYVILLTERPPLRVCGKLDEHCRPTSAELQMQDWLMPMTVYDEASEEMLETLLRFASVFRFSD
jgi:hypothetical protein